jgi:hypothetical protein
MLLDNVLHDDSVYGNVPSGQHVLVEKFLFHKLVKYFLLLVLIEGRKGLLLFIYDFRDCSSMMCFLVASKEDCDIIGW